MKLPDGQLASLSRLLDDALDLPREARLVWLENLGPDHAHLKTLLEELLLRDDLVETSDFLNELPRLDWNERDVRTGQAPAFEAGSIIGRYRLIRILGTGGMGEVWLAERSDGAFGRPTALKLPHAHLLAGALRQRFERERAILAALSHPQIAALYDAGISDEGHPYLAMEWVDGAPITEYCRESRAGLEMRLELLRQVLSAIAYAHSRFVAHRDLKPSNILVTREGKVKLLDFGVAKMLSGDGDGRETELTQLGGRAVTPEYAAPEQLAGQPMTTRVDIYSLGVVLFELLTGTRPGRGAGAPAASGSVRDDHAATCGLTPSALRKALRGDLDAILAKALEANPNDRYASAESFAEDLLRHQRDVPITARRVGRLTLASKFVRRHRLPAALTAGLVAAMLAGTVGVGIASIRARQAAARAEREAGRATATKDFLVEVFKASDPRIASDRPRGSITAKELLDVGATRIERQFGSDPQTEVELLGLVADIYAELDETPRSEELLRKQIELARRYYGEAHPIVIQAMLRQANFANVRSDYAGALRSLATIDRLIERAGLDQSVERAIWWQVRSGALIADESTEAAMVDALQHSVDLFARYGPQNRFYPPALSDLANVYLGRHEFAKAVDYNRRAVAAAETQPSGDEGDLAQLYGNLGITLTYDGEFGAAEKAYARAMQLARSTYGESSRSYWVPAARYAEVVHLGGDYRRADALFEKLFSSLPPAAQKLSLLDRHELAIVRETYGTRLAAEGRAALAVPLLESAVQEYDASQGYFYESIGARSTLGAAYAAVGRSADARRLLKATLDQRVSSFPKGHPSTLRSREAWGRFLLEQGEIEEAARQLQIVVQTTPANTEFFMALAHADLARIALTRGALPDALAASERAVEDFAHVSGFRDVRVGPYVARVRAEVLLRTGDRTAAAALAKAAVEDLERYCVPESAETAAAGATLRAALGAGRAPLTPANPAL